MKPTESIFIFFVISLVAISFSNPESATYCRREVVERKTKVFLKDEAIETTMMQVMDKETKKFLFGYFISALRNDTNFIYSKIHYVGDTILIKTYRDHRISDGTDSTISKYICKKTRLVFYNYTSFFKGRIKHEQVFNSTVIKY